MYYGEPSHVVRECPKKSCPHAVCAISITNPQPKKLGNKHVQSQIGTPRLYFDASCNENGPSLSLDLAPCFLVPIIVKCNKFVTMEAQSLLDYGTLACFIDKELVRQFKLTQVENNTLVLVEIIDSQNLSLRLITYETKALDVTICSHTSKIIFNVISFLRNLIIIGLFWLVLHSPQMD